MKTFKAFIENTAGVPTNVTGAGVATDQPVVSKVISNKYKKKNEKETINNVALIRRTLSTGATRS